MAAATNVLSCLLCTIDTSRNLDVRYTHQSMS